MWIGQKEVTDFFRGLDIESIIHISKFDQLFYKNLNCRNGLQNIFETLINKFSASEIKTIDIDTIQSEINELQISTRIRRSMNSTTLYQISRHVINIDVLTFQADIIDEFCQIIYEKPFTQTRLVI